MLIPLETPLAIDALLVPDMPLELDPPPPLDSPLVPLLLEPLVLLDSPLEPETLLVPDSLLMPDAPLELDALVPLEEPTEPDPLERPLDPLPLEELLEPLTPEPLELPLLEPLEPLEPGTGLGPGLGEDPLGLGLGMGDTPLALEVGFRGVVASLSELLSINISLRFLSGTPLRCVGYDASVTMRRLRFNRANARIEPKQRLLDSPCNYIYANYIRKFQYFYLFELFDMGYQRGIHVPSDGCIIVC